METLALVPTANHLPNSLHLLRREMVGTSKHSIWEGGQCTSTANIKTRVGFFLSKNSMGTRTDVWLDKRVALPRYRTEIGLRWTQKPLSRGFESTLCAKLVSQSNTKQRRYKLPSSWCHAWFQLFGTGQSTTSTTVRDIRSGVRWYRRCWCDGHWPCEMVVADVAGASAMISDIFGHGCYPLILLTRAFRVGYYVFPHSLQRGITRGTCDLSVIRS